MQHLAFIIDGNGRWGERHSGGRMAGYAAGADAVMRAILAADELNIPYVSFYAFSLENYKRSKTETMGIFGVIADLLEQRLLPLVKERGYRVRFIGRLQGLPEPLLDAITKVNVAGLNNRNMTIIIAVAYGGRDEVVTAFEYILNQRIINSDISALTYEEIERALYTAMLPDPDAVVRYGGYKRLSNFMPLQTVYSELFFIDKLWPDFSKEDILYIYDSYKRITRKFGDLPK
ncbi:MAG: polyprenyl diphosphate synthase [Clostridia bacterium]